MAKLYAELSSDKSTRIASKGGDEYINVKLQAGNRILGHVQIKSGNDGLTYIEWCNSQLPFGHIDRVQVLQIIKA